MPFSDRRQQTLQGVTVLLIIAGVAPDVTEKMFAVCLECAALNAHAAPQWRYAISSATRQNYVMMSKHGVAALHLD